MIPQKKHRSNINGSKSVASNKEMSHVSVHGDTFNSSGDYNRSDSSGGFNKSESSCGFNSSAGGCFAWTDEGTTCSTRYFSEALCSVENVATPKVPRHIGRV